MSKNTAGKNIVICLDGTGNQFGEDKSNVVKLFRMLERQAGEQVAYYDPGVGTMGDPTYKTRTARKINKVLGLAFGRGLTKNLIEAYTYLMEHYEEGDRVFLFGFSRGAYTARALAGFIRQCGLFERGAENLIPYAMGLFLKKPPRKLSGEAVAEKRRKGLKDPYEEHFKILSGFRSTYGRKFRIEDDPKLPRRKVRPGDDQYHYQLRIHFMGLFDTVKSYGWVRNPVDLRNESENASVLRLRHALAIDERRIFFRQLHWVSSPKQDCKEVWFSGVHSDVGGGYPEPQSGLAKVALEWMVHEACQFGMKVDPFRYRRIMGKVKNEQGEWKDGQDPKYPAPNARADAHESLEKAWKLIQRLPKKLEDWEEEKAHRTIKPEGARLPLKKEALPLLFHESVFERMSTRGDYRPDNLVSALSGNEGGDVLADLIEKTLPTEEVVAEEEAAADAKVKSVQQSPRSEGASRR